MSFSGQFSVDCLAESMHSGLLVGWLVGWLVCLFVCVVFFQTNVYRLATMAISNVMYRRPFSNVTQTNCECKSFCRPLACVKYTNDQWQCHSWLAITIAIWYGICPLRYGFVACLINCTDWIQWCNGGEDYGCTSNRLYVLIAFNMIILCMICGW